MPLALLVILKKRKSFLFSCNSSNYSVAIQHNVIARQIETEYIVLFTPSVDRHHRRAWKRLEAPGSPWKHLEAPGSPWKHLLCCWKRTNIRSVSWYTLSFQPAQRSSREVQPPQSALNVYQTMYEQCYEQTLRSLTWKHLEAPGRTWKHLEASGSTRRHLTHSVYRNKSICYSKSCLEV